MVSPARSGRWWIDSAHTRHVLDLDAMTHEARPIGAGDALDRGQHLVESVDRWPQVGDRLRASCTRRSDPWSRRIVVESDPVVAIARATTAHDELAAAVPGHWSGKIPSGWCALVQALHADLSDLVPEYTCTRIDEDRGGLIFSVSLPEETPGGAAAAAYARIAWAEDEARDRCGVCGAPGGWAGRRCDRHR